MNIFDENISELDHRTELNPSPTMHRGMDHPAMGASGRLGVVSWFDHKMQGIIVTVEGINDVNVWEVEQLCDSLEMLRIRPPFRAFCRETKNYQKTA